MYGLDLFFGDDMVEQASGASRLSSRHTIMTDTATGSTTLCRKMQTAARDLRIMQSMPWRAGSAAFVSHRAEVDQRKDMWGAAIGDVICKLIAEQALKVVERLARKGGEISRHRGHGGDDHIG